MKCEWSPAGWTRRQVVRAGAAAALVPAAGSLLGVASSCRGRDSPDSAEIPAELEPIIAEIRAGLGDVAVDPEALEDFARDYHRFQQEGLLTDLAEVDLPRRFLLSSDLFDAGRDPEAAAVYVVFYDPYLTPCSNRLASLPGARS